MTDTDVTPEEAFAVLGNETRIDIIRMLSAADGGPLTFSALRERVGKPDSGQFNYHLKRLVGTFIQRTEEGDYELSYAGNRVVGAIFSGEFTRRTTSEAFSLDSACAGCGSDLEAVYADETVKIHCPDCEEIDTGFGFPPGGIEDRSAGELTRVFDSWLRSVFALVANGICHNCAGPLTVGFTADSEHRHSEGLVTIEYVCDRCSDGASLSISSYLYLRPDVIEFFNDHDVNLHAIDMWNARAFLDPTVTVTAEDPWEVQATFELDDEEFSITIDEDLMTASV